MPLKYLGRPAAAANELLTMGEVDADIAAAIALLGQWKTFTPTLTASTTDPNIGTTGSVQTSRYMQLGKTVIYQGIIKFGSGSSTGNGSYYISLPVAANNTAYAARRIGDGCVETTVYDMVQYQLASTTTCNLRKASAFVNNTWGIGNGHSIQWWLTYEAS